MEFIFISDLHLSGYTNDKMIAEENLSERLFYIKNALHNVITYCKENKINNIKIGGDSLHNKSIIHTIALSVLLNFIRENKDIHFDIIDGNHDLSGKGETVVSALISLDNEPNVKRIGVEHILFKDEKHDILYVPYSSKMVNIIKNNSAKYLISHFGLNEGILNSGQSIVGEIKLSDLIGKYETVLVGHYHNPQKIIREDISLYYSGSLIHLTWNDKNEEKRFLVINTDSKQVISVPTTGYRKYFELIITSENKEEIIKTAREMKKSGHLVNIKKEVDIETKDIEDEFQIIDRIDKDITNRGLSTSMTEMEIIKKYLEIKNIRKEDFESYQKVALEIISESSEKV